MQKIVCSISSKEQDKIVLLQSIVDNKKTEKAVSTLGVHDLTTETGLDVLIEKLDNAFKDEIAEDSYDDKWRPATNDINTCFWLSFKSVKSTLKRAFGETSYMNILNDNITSSDPIIKEEDEFYMAQKKYK